MNRTLALFVLCSAAGLAGAADITYWNETLSDRAAIAAAQRALRAEGYDPGPADGRLRPKTAEAVFEAQKDRELEPTGRLDRRTAAALGVPLSPPRPAAAGGTAGGS